MKPGIKTTEFWLSLAAVVVGATVVVVPEGSIWAKALGVALAALSSLGYSALRSGLKHTSKNS